MTQISTFFGLQQSLRGLLAHQRTIDVTGHNITNSNTQGYSRQEAVMGSATPYDIEAGLLVDGGGAQLGAGVEIQQFRRIRDAFLDLQYRAQSLRLGEYEGNASALAQIEEGLSEPGTNGLAAQLDKFWSAWSNVANNPENLATRQALVEQAKTVTASIHDLDARITLIKTQTTSEYAAITGATGDVRSMADEIAKLNQAIKFAVADGDSPNDLYDRRDLLLDQLSSMGQVSVTQSPGGSLDVSLGGVTIVDADDTTGIATVPAGTFPLSFGTNPGGRLGALIDLQSATGPIGSYQTDLAAMAQSLTNSVNAVYGASGTSFFTYGVGTSGLPEIHLNEPAISATTLVGGTGGQSDNTLALAIHNLRGGDADKRYQQLVTRMGNEVSQAARAEATAQVLTDNLSDRRESVSGVSLDEEMTNIIRFQRAYQASARAMSTTDEMLDTLINRAGRVGL